MKKLITAILTLALLLTLTATAFAAERRGSIGDLSSAIAPRSFDTDSLQKFQQEGNRAYALEERTNNLAMTRHQLLLSQGWELGGVSVEEFDVPASERISAASTSSKGVVITGYKVVRFY